VYEAIMRYFAAQEELERLFPHSMRRECRDQVRASFGLGPDPYGEWL
jgi:hypothetical protein